MAGDAYILSPMEFFEIYWNLGLALITVTTP
jgi:hypothetical protein